ncbi:hypothetical protein AMTRI_Chr09g39020 [Amborella trichopoda]
MAGKKGVHLVKWNTICLPQEEGGSWLCDIVGFNIAGMLKLAWRILADPSSLFDQFFKHYFWADSWLSEKSIWDSYGTIVYQELEVAMPKVSDHIGGVPQSWEVQNNILPLQPHRDFLVWINSVSDLFSIKEAKEHIHNKGISQPIFRTLWSAKCHPPSEMVFLVGPPSSVTYYFSLVAAWDCYGSSCIPLLQK